MEQSINSLFSDKNIISKIQDKLPKLFRIAELETMRGGKIGRKK